MIAGIARRFRSIPPEVPSSFLVRPRMHDLLDRSVRMNMTVLHAPTGFGKTTAVAGWARGQHGRVAWFSLDATDNHPARFVLGAILAIQEFDPLFGQDLAFSVLQDSDLEPFDLGSQFVDSLDTLSAPIILVLDDVHLLRSPDALAVLETILRFPSERLHLVLIAQHDLSAMLAGARVRGQVADISMPDLAFTPTEARAFLHGWMDERLSAVETETVTRAAEGWIAGLKLGAMAVLGDATHGQEAVQRSTSHLSRLLDGYVDDVMSRWSPSLRRLMGVVALLTRVSPSLLEAVAGEWLDGQPGATFLDDAEAHGLFLAPLDADRSWYQLHSVFRDALYRRMPLLLTSSEVLAIQRRTAEWYLGQGQIADAVAHAMAAEDEDLAVSIVRTHVHRALAFDEWLEIDEWLALIPAARTWQEPDLLLAQAWVHQARGQSDAALAVVHRAREVLARTSEIRTPADDALYTCELDLLEVLAPADASPVAKTLDVHARSYLALQDEDRFATLVAMQYHLLALSRTDQAGFDAEVAAILQRYAALTTPFAQLRVLFVRIVQTLAAGRDGHAMTLLDLSERVLRRAQALKSVRQEAFGHFLVGSMQYELNELALAEDHFRAVLANPRAGIRVRVGSEARLARVLDALGRRDEADDLLRRGSDRLLETEATGYLRILRSAELSLAIQRGDSMATGRLAGMLDTGDDSDHATVVEAPEIKLALFDTIRPLASGLARSNERLSALEQQGDRLHWLAPRLQVRLIRALWHDRRGDWAMASQALAGVLLEAETAGYIRTVVDLGPGMRDLLERYLAQVGPSRYLEYLLGAFDRVDQADAKPIGEDQRPDRHFAQAAGDLLTEREIDILLGLQARLTNKEIAATLSISPLTVKSHAQNIYSKLGVNSRRKAIQKAAELEILPAGEPSRFLS